MAVNEYITSSVQRLEMVIVAFINCVLRAFDDMWLNSSIGEWLNYR
jgi:hypothetical protein